MNRVNQLTRFTIHWDSSSMFMFSAGLCLEVLSSGGF